MGEQQDAGSDIAVYYGNRNILWYVVKNFPLRTILISSPWIIGRNCRRYSLLFPPEKQG